MSELDEKPIPDHWELVIEKQKNGSKSLVIKDWKSYVCPASGQAFTDYDQLMRYIDYAIAEKRSIYAPGFSPIISKKKTKTLKKCHSKKKSEQQNSSVKSRKRFDGHHGEVQNLPGKKIRRSAFRQDMDLNPTILGSIITLELEESYDDKRSIPELEEKCDVGGESEKDFRFTYSRRRYRNRN